MSKAKYPMWHILIRYGDRELEFYTDDLNDIIPEILRWFRDNFEPKDWPSILKWTEGIKE